jgi:salicylate hydroxylase
MELPLTGKLDAWSEADAPVEELLEPYPDLDSQVFKHLEIGKEIRPWRLWVHDPYTHWIKGNTCIIGDSAHPMMPDQSQGACMAIEDAAALGIIFSQKYYPGSVQQAMELYQTIRKPRATKVQAAAARARENIHERIGKSASSTVHRFLTRC